MRPRPRRLRRTSRRGRRRSRSRAGRRRPAQSRARRRKAPESMRGHGRGGAPTALPAPKPDCETTEYDRVRREVFEQLQGGVGEGRSSGYSRWRRATPTRRTPQDHRRARRSRGPSSPTSPTRRTRRAATRKAAAARGSPCRELGSAAPTVTRSKSERARGARTRVGSRTPAGCARGASHVAPVRSISPTMPSLDPSVARVAATTPTAHARERRDGRVPRTARARSSGPIAGEHAQSRHCLDGDDDQNRDGGAHLVLRTTHTSFRRGRSRGWWWTA